ncbi:MAG: sel1 repeat family protein [Kordiimonadaceae bacterium]|nr:sel1 repeat family protein [Kordiimonadaceae bacterium]MBO6567836.1 sel1 repeat family protein [Kordiimonadaceae bacterium]MBO6964434.1 sel1 repeat family protein [Kordiimonadaceae bacterium]
MRTEAKPTYILWMVVALAGLAFIWAPQRTVALPAEIRANACAPTYNFPIVQRIIDGQIDVDARGFVASLATKHIENPYFPDFFEDDQIKDHIQAVMQQSFSFNLYPDEVVEDYIAGSSDPVLQDEMQRSHLRDQATKFTHLQKLLEEFFKLQVNADILKYSLENFRSKEDGSLRLATSNVPREEGFAYIDERYAHHLSKGHTETGATFRAFFDLHNYGDKKYNKYSKGPVRRSGQLTEIDDVDEKIRDVLWLKVGLIARSLNIPRQYAKADRRLNPWRLFNDFMIHPIRLEEILPDFSSAGILTTEGAFSNRHCPINDSTHDVFATAQDIETDFFLRKGISPLATPDTSDPDWCAPIVTFDAVTSKPSVFLPPRAGETGTPGAELDTVIRKLTVAAQSSCPGLKQVHINGFHAMDKRRLYSAGFTPLADTYLRAVGFADKFLPLYFRIEEGDAEAMYFLSVVYAQGGLKDKWQERYWRYRAAEAGHAPSQAMIAAAYGPEYTALAKTWGERGWMKTNTYKGLYWAKKSADQGDPLGMWNYAKFLKIHHYGGVYSPEAWIKMWKYNAMGGISLMELLYKGDKYKDTRRDAFNRLAGLTSPLVEAAAYEMRAGETCQLDQFRRPDTIHGPGCASVISIYQSWRWRVLGQCDGVLSGDKCMFIEPD